MLIAARNSFMVGGKLSAKSYPYMPDLGFWDGIENIGYGQHSATPAYWKDLTNNGYDFQHLNAIGAWTKDSAVFSGRANAAELWNINGILTLEVVGKANQISYFAFSLFSSGSLPKRMFAILPNNNRGFQFESGRHSMFRDWYSDRWSVAAVWGNGPDTQQSAQYYNGLFSASNTRTSDWNTPINRAILGRSIDSYHYSGEICCIRAHSRFLTADEIAANYAVDKARFNLP